MSKNPAPAPALRAGTRLPETVRLAAALLLLLPAAACVSYHPPQVPLPRPVETAILASALEENAGYSLAEERLQIKDEEAVTEAYQGMIVQALTDSRAPQETRREGFNVTTLRGALDVEEGDPRFSYMGVFQSPVRTRILYRNGVIFGSSYTILQDIREAGGEESPAFRAFRGLFPGAEWEDLEAFYRRGWFLRETGEPEVVSLERTGLTGVSRKGILTLDVPVRILYALASDLHFEMGMYRASQYQPRPEYAVQETLRVEVPVVFPEGAAPSEKAPPQKTETPAQNAADGDSGDASPADRAEDSQNGAQDGGEADSGEDSLDEVQRMQEEAAAQEAARAEGSGDGVGTAVKKAVGRGFKAVRDFFYYGMNPHLREDAEDKSGEDADKEAEETDKEPEEEAPTPEET